MDRSFIEQVLAPLMRREPLPELSPRRIWNQAIEKEIARGSMQQWFACKANEEQELTFKAGLHLLNDSLYASHDCCQDANNATGSYWHGIMHRMEGDYPNAKYWFRMAGNHPVRRQMAEAVRRLTPSENPGQAASAPFLDALMANAVWDPALFVDAVRAAETGEAAFDEQQMQLMRKLQYMEMLQLLDYAYQQACEGSLLDLVNKKQ